MEGRETTIFYFLRVYPRFSLLLYKNVSLSNLKNGPKTVFICPNYQIELYELFSTSFIGQWVKMLQNRPVFSTPY